MTFYSTKELAEIFSVTGDVIYHWCFLGLEYGWYKNNRIFNIYDVVEFLDETKGEFNNFYIDR